MRVLARLPLALALLVGACSVVPPQGFPDSDEREVEVRYELPLAGGSSVQVPASGPDLTVLWLRAEPGAVKETFDSGTRHLHSDASELVIHCRYRVYQRREEARGALRPPEQLFPGATSIRTVWRRDAGS